MSARQHGRIERALHRFAFGTQRAQLGLADLEQRLFRRELAATTTGPPVFVTGLPRAGTTMLHELIASCAAFATHTNRDLPFVLCPMLWRSFARRWGRAVAPHERAHGDGIMVSADSPLAAEEVLWARLWPEHYSAHTIAPWSSCARAEFVQFFADHRRKVVALRARDEPAARRYVSKNNVNIGRLPALFEIVPDALVLVPFRDPRQQAASLLRQHLRFLALHQRDPFARRFMADTGHREFGADLRVIDFGGWCAERSPQQALQLPFWLDYWLATHRHLLDMAHDPRVAFVDFARLAANQDVSSLAAALDTPHAALAAQVTQLRPLPARDVDLSMLPGAMRDELQDVYAALLQRALP